MKRLDSSVCGVGGVMSLDDACEFIVDCLHKTAPVQVNGYPSIRTPNIGRGRLLLNGVNRVSEEVYAEWTKRARPEPGDLILAREAPAGNVAIVGEGQKVCLGQRTVHLRPDLCKVDAAFLCYYLLAPRQQGALLAGKTGATAGHVNLRDIRRLNLGQLPRLSEQKRMAQVLSVYDDLIENNLRRIALLEEAARLVYREWFVHFRYPGQQRARVVDGVPKEWVRGSVGDVAELRYGKALKQETRVPGPFPVYGSSGVIGSHESALIGGPIVIVGRKGNVGSIHWCDGGCWPIDTVYFVPSHQSDLWLYHTLPSVGFQNTHTGVPGLNRDFAYSREINIPPSDLRKSFNEDVQPLFSQVATLRLLNKALTKARDLLLPRLMNGDVSV